MSYLVAAPEMLASTAADVENLGSAISTAGANAAGPTTGVLAAAQDEVSATIANLFGTYGRQYQALIAQAAAFNNQFTQALAAAGSAYTQAEATNAAVVSNAVSAFSTSVQSQLGLTPTGSGASPAATVALIMGGTSNPGPSLDYINAVFNSYIQRLFPGAVPQGLFTPEQFWPVTPQLGNATFGQSVFYGVVALNNALLGPTGVLTQGNTAVVFGYSQSATIATNEITALMAAGSPDVGRLSFILIGDPNNPDGGLLERFPGFYIPFLDVAFNGATPPNSPYPTTIYTLQYDGIADAPRYPLNIFSDVNALMGYFYVHNTYPMLTPEQVGNAVQLPTSPGYTGSTTYYMLLSQNLPLLQPIRDIPYAGPPIADIFQPDLRVLVDLGYSDYGPGQSYANIPTPASLFGLPNPLTVIPDLALGTVLGPYGAVVDIATESGLPAQAYYPNVYPWTPSIDPGLNIFLGQSSTTRLSALSGAIGAAMPHVVPPILF
jgi:PE-PPE domain/PE family